APFFFQSTYYKRTPAPVRLQKKGQEMFGVVSYKGSGVDIKVTDKKICGWVSKNKIHSFFL
ncbi:MAG: hypothetical protein ABFC94_09910, partial [Syntrophomonas sp.]